MLVPRSEGALRLSFKQRGPATVLDHLFQSGCLRARMLRVDPRHATETVLLNTAGGLTGGDRLSLNIAWGADTRATVTTQACEKIYRATSGEAYVETALDIESGATAEWLPQETILFDGASLWRDIRVRLGVDAVFTGIEAVVLGRTAMGEMVRHARLKDRWRIWRGEQLVYADSLELDGDILALIDKTPVTQGRIAFACLLHTSPTVDAALETVRALLPIHGCVTGASAWKGLLAVRFVAESGALLRAATLRVLEILRREPMPRVWQI